MTKKYKINGKEIESFDMDNAIHTEATLKYRFNELLEALADKEDLVANGFTMPRAETTTEQKERYLDGWEGQENWIYTKAVKSDYLTKQTYIARINQTINAINKEEVWVADWSDENQEKYNISYDYEDKKFNSYLNISRQCLFIFNYGCEKALQFILDNYQEELFIILNINR